jgi:hypothetical protein
MIYGDTEKETLDKTVRFVIILLILVFDPLAILLVVAANMSLKEHRGESITFMTEKDFESESEDYGIEDVSENVQTEEDVQDEKQNEEMDITEDDLQHVQRLDRRVRKKLEWLIDKKGK